MTIKEDCFAYDKAKNECKACRDLNCRNCKFYKEKSKYIIESGKQRIGKTVTEKNFEDSCET